MLQSKKTNIFTVITLLGIIAVFAFAYNAYVSSIVTDAAYNDKEILQNYNNEIISKLIEADSVSLWDEIISQYEGIIISIEDGYNNIIVKSEGEAWSSLDVKVQTPFEYNGNAYLIKSSVYLLRDYVADVRVVLKFIFIEFMIVISALALLIFTIYTIMLRPFKKLYKCIEEYDKTGELKKTNIRGYAGQIYKRFVSMTENLEANQNNRRRIIASISHDIKTPLTSIMGYAEQLQKDTVTQERKKRYLNTVYDKSIEIKELVNEFDEYLSFEQKQQLNRKICNTERMAEQIKEEYAVDLEDIGIDFAVNNYAKTTKVSVDRQKIKRVLGNILSNCVKHFKKEEKIIRIDINADREKVYIDIHDNGEGVEEEKLDLIFEPLYTSDEGRKVAGLGLAICHEIIDGHGGKIYAKKSDLGGLAVCIELPAVK